MLKVVFDTNIFLRALINPSGPNARLIFQSDRYELLLSEEIIAEILEVLFRSSLREKYTAIKELDIREVLNIIAEAKIIRPGQKITVCRDSDDNKFLECAVSGGADYLVSADKDLLDLKECRGVKIVSATNFLKES